MRSSKKEKFWVVTDTMMKLLEGFHHMISRRILGMTAQRGAGGEWEWVPVEAALEEAGLWPTRESMRRRQATIVEYIADRPIYELCTGAERMEGSRRFLWWWDQDHGPTQADRKVG